MCYCSVEQTSNSTVAGLELFAHTHIHSGTKNNRNVVYNFIFLVMSFFFLLQIETRWIHEQSSLL